MGLQKIRGYEDFLNLFVEEVEGRTVDAKDRVYMDVCVS